MTKLDSETGYPPSYEPSWWECPECSKHWHDSEEQGHDWLDWEDSPQCSQGLCRGVNMIRVASRGSAREEPSPNQTDK